MKNDVRFIPLCLDRWALLSVSRYLSVFLFHDDDDGGDGGDEGEEELKRKSSKKRRRKQFRKSVKRWIEDVPPYDRWIEDRSSTGKRLIRDVTTDNGWIKVSADYDIRDMSNFNSKYNHLPGVLNFELPSEDYNASPTLLGHCNGILCLFHHSWILLVNPLLKETKLLRNYRSHQPCLVGFGFDNIETMNFKVVRVFGGSRQFGGNAQLEAEVCNLKTNDDVWRKLTVYPYDIYNYDDHYTFFNGFIYWCVQVRQYHRWQMLAFNLATELFQLMDLPQDWLPIYIDCPKISLFVLNQDSLAFINYSEDLSSMLVWSMNNNNQHGNATWTKLYSFGPLPLVSRPISPWNEHKFLYRTYKGKLVLYDERNGRRSLVFDDSPVRESREDRNPPNRYSEINLNVQAGVLCGACLVSINK